MFKRFLSLGVLASVCGLLLFACEKKPTNSGDSTGSTSGQSKATTESTKSGGLELATAVDIPMSGGGTVTGTVKFEGSPPALPPIDMSQKQDCHALHGGKPVPADILVVNPNQTLKDTVVFLSGDFPKYKTPKDPVTLDQKGCLYVPHVFGIMRGQPLRLLNSDPWLHNVNCETMKFNDSMSKGAGEEIVKKKGITSSAEQPVSFKCSVHSWMTAYAFPLEHPFYSVSGDTGAFEIKNVPAGTYTLKTWHQKAPGLKAPAEVTIEVKEGETTQIDVVYKI